MFLKLLHYSSMALFSVLPCFQTYNSVYRVLVYHRTLTGPAMGGGAALIFPTSGVHQYGVESAGHQAVKHTLAHSLRHCLVLQEHVVVFDKHLVEVKVSGGVMPVNLQVVIPSSVGRCRVLDL